MNISGIQPEYSINGLVDFTSYDVRPIYSLDIRLIQTLDGTNLITIHFVSFEFDVLVDCRTSNLFQPSATFRYI